MADESPLPLRERVASDVPARHEPGEGYLVGRCARPPHPLCSLPLAIADATHRRCVIRRASEVTPMTLSRKGRGNSRPSWPGLSRLRAEADAVIVRSLRPFGGEGPAIHAFSRELKAWMPGTRPGMTGSVSRAQPLEKLRGVRATQ
jgi:hypothetical protein